LVEEAVDYLYYLVIVANINVDSVSTQHLSDAFGELASAGQYLIDDTELCATLSPDLVMLRAELTQKAVEVCGAVLGSG
jgi:hypothetical protein